MKICYSLLAVVALVNSVRPAIVTCEDGDTSCVCPVNETVCEFTLKLKRRPTYTSFKFDSDGSMMSTGALYVVDEALGYRAAIRGEGIDCLFDGDLRRDSDFTSRGCSVPILYALPSIITINGISPGPTLVVDNDATVYVHAINNLEAETSIHWHGMYQRHTSWMDGVGFITQPTIKVDTSFDYIFQARPFGTHWYHSHVGSQRIEGMYGALVVRGTSPPDSSELIPEDENAIIVDIPEESTLLLFDPQDESPIDQFLKARTLGYEATFNTVEYLRGTTFIERGRRYDGSDNGPIPFYSGFINGRGRVGNNIAPLSVFNVTYGDYKLIRIVGAMSQEAYMFSIEGHTLRVIATDGKDVEYMDVECVSVESGERYDVLVHANATIGNYYIRADSLQANVPDGEEYTARAVLSYQGAETLDWTNGYSNVPERQRECTPESKCRVLNCAFQNYTTDSEFTCVSLLDLVPRPRKDESELPKYPPSDMCPDCMHFLNFAAEASVSDMPHSVNAKSMELPINSYQTLCGQYDRDNSNDSTVNTCEKNCIDVPEEGCECINVIPLANEAVFIDGKGSDELESIVLVFSSFGSGGSHPIHVHGHAFQVVYIGYGTYDKNGELDEPTTDIVCDSPCTAPRWRDDTIPTGVLARVKNGRVTTDAIQKDTVVIPVGGYVVIAFNADNPGYWLIHCHIEAHIIGGMNAILQEYSPDQQWLPPPNINLDGDFKWNVTDYNKHIEDAMICSKLLPAAVDSEFHINRVQGRPPLQIHPGGGGLGRPPQPTQTTQQDFGPQYATPQYATPQYATPIFNTRPPQPTKPNHGRRGRLFPQHPR